MTKKILIFKNDAVGDLVQSLDAINNIIINNKNKKIYLFLSERSKNFDFLFNRKNINIKILNYNLLLLDKIKILLDIFKPDIEAIYILTPKKFYFYLPVFFKKIKFYGLCINSTNNYKRPSLFLRKHLFKYVVNERDKLTKRKSTMEIQRDLTKGKQFNKKYELNSIPNIKYDDLELNNYIYFHLKLSNFNKLGWGLNELKIIFDEFLKHKKNIIFTRDIENKKSHDYYDNYFNVINFNTNKRTRNSTNIFLYDNIKGSDLYNVIRNADKVVAFHGMMTNLASIENRPVLDLFYCDIRNLDDYRRYKNALYEFKPKYKDYDFIVPSRNIQKTIKKMKFFLRK